MRQILINLLGNAIKFTTTGEVTLRARHGREMATLEVSDTGPGMVAEELTRIFEPFARGVGATAGAPGAGLGLTIAKMLTELMGGEMSVESEAGRGSTFRVRLFLPELHGEWPVSTISTVSTATTGAAAPTERTDRPARAEPIDVPPPERLAGLREALQLGYYRGVLRQLDEIEAADPAWRGFCEAQRPMALQFQFEAMLRGLARGGDPA